MKKILILLASLLVVGNVFALPQCPPNDYRDSCYAAHTYPDGSKYEGEWKDGKQHGQGTYSWHDGDQYVGEWKDDKPHGQGIYTWPNGDKHVGEFKGGELWNGEMFLGEVLVGSSSSGKKTLSNSVFASLPKEVVFELVAELFYEGDDGVFAYFGNTKEATLAEIEEEYKKCIDQESFSPVCEVHYHGDIVLEVFDLIGIKAKEATLFFEDRYVGSRVELMGSKFFAEAFDREVREARINHPELEFHLDLVRDDQIILWVSESLELAASIIESSHDDSLGNNHDALDIEIEFFEGDVIFLSGSYEFTQFQISSNNAVIQVKNDTHLRFEPSSSDGLQLKILAPMSAVKNQSGSIPDDYIRRYTLGYYIALRDQYEGKAEGRELSELLPPFSPGEVESLFSISHTNWEEGFLPEMVSIYSKEFEVQTYGHESGTALMAIFPDAQSGFSIQPFYYNPSQPLDMLWFTIWVHNSSPLAEITDEDVQYLEDAYQSESGTHSFSINKTVSGDLVGVEWQFIR